MKKDKSIDVLNSLIVINNDRIQGYETAIDETEDQDLKVMFGEFLQTSQKCKQDLISEVTKLGGKPEEGTRTDGKIYRMWMDFKSAVTGHDRKAILNSCEYGEDVAVNTYENVIEDKSSDLTPDQIAMVNKQYSMIKANHDKVRVMRDASVEA
jgi:uncharacterized protein (TIGR02284 family)